MKRALVLGCGGVAGAAWSIPTLKQLSQDLDWDPRNADMLVGTSAGAVLAALLGAGVSIDQLMEFQQQGRISGSRLHWNHDSSWGKPYPPLPKLAFPGTGLFKRSFKQDISPFAALCGLSPAGQMNMGSLVHLIDSFTDTGEWVDHPDCRIMVVDANSGEHVALGTEQAPNTSIQTAVCASYAIPSWCPPVEIAGKTFLDGGVASPTAATQALDSDIEEVIILAPMSSPVLDKTRHPFNKAERQVRRAMTKIVDKEVAQLRAAGKRVIRLEPGPEDLQAIGYNMMDHRRREQVFVTAQRTAGEAVELALDY